MSEKIFYYSTNRKLKTENIKGFKDLVSFKKALFLGQAPDQGLFMPTRIPKFSKEELRKLKGKPFHKVAYQVLRKYLKSEIKDDELRKITRGALNFKIPFEELTKKIYIMRLDQGPTASFKDFAARVMARLMEKLRPQGKKINILVATSGDTGSAIGQAYKGVKGIKVVILYPEDEVSPTQKKQLDSIGENVQSISVEGKFDDCQKLVKLAFADPGLKKLNLTSANSINIARILPQISYYFYAYIRLANLKSMEKIIFSVPSGNFGNSLGCELARRMGLAVKKLILATNENDEFPRFLKTGIYEKISPSRKCLSNAMNVGNPSNLARYFELYGGNVDKDGIVHKKPDLDQMRKRLYSVSISDERTRKTIKEVYKKYRRLLEPHGAVGIAGLFHYLKKTKEKNLSVSVETAHPAKFPEVLREFKISPEMPDSMKGLEKQKGRADRLPNDYRQFKDYLLKNLKN